MKKAVLAFGILILVQSAHAGLKPVTCNGLSPQGKELVFVFEFGETAKVTYGDKVGECQSDPGAIELSLTCFVPTSTDSGYRVHLASGGGIKLYSQAVPESMRGEGTPITLKCTNMAF